MSKQWGEWEFGRGPMRCSLTMWEEWCQLIGSGWNWKNFTLVTATLEWGGYKGRYFEVRLGLLGFNVEIEAYDYVDRTIKLGPVMAMRDDWFTRDGDTQPPTGAEGGMDG